MRELIDRFAARAGWQVPLPERQMVEIESSVLPLRESEDEAKRSARRRKVDLDAAGKTGAISRLLVAGEECVNSLPLALQSRASFFGNPLRAARGLA